MPFGTPDPATNEFLGTVPDMGIAETKKAIDSAADAFKTWSKTSAKVYTTLPGIRTLV